MSWQACTFAILAVTLLSGFVWFERSRPSGRLVAAVAALAALGIAGRIAFAPIPNVVATTDVALLAGYSFGGAPGFAVGALSGLISNFWLGQGPWTPWQMAGWGMAGVAGAALARLGGRKLGRLPLALFAALVGLAYGAFLDLSVMVSYGGEQSLERYLALSVRAIPFNIAHAAGNFVLMFVAGPALIRMLDRYRKRVEFRWGDHPLRSAAACLLLLLCLLGPTLVAPAPAEAVAGKAKAVEWMRAAQNADGGFGVSSDTESNVGMTGWAALGLAASGANPRDVKKAGSSPIEFLRANVERISSTGDLERTILVLTASGVDPRQFSGRDLIAELRDRKGKDGSYEGQVNLTAFAILALRSAGVEKSKLERSSKWLVAAQNKDGGWGSRAGGNSDPDSTGAVLQAFAVGPGGGRSIDPGVRWLSRSQGRSGGWSLTPAAAANSQSTAWSIQGLHAVGRNPQKVKSNGNNGFDFIARMQRKNGSYDYSTESDQTPVWVTAQALAAVSKESFPLPEVPREKKEKPKKDENDNSNSSSSPSYSPGPSSSYTPDTSSPSYDYGNDNSRGSGKGNGNGVGTLGGEAGQTVDPSAQVPTPEDGDGLDPANPFDSFGEEDSQERPEDTFEAPSTPVLLGGLGGLTGLLGVGFMLFRRRLP